MAETSFFRLQVIVLALDLVPSTENYPGDRGGRTPFTCFFIIYGGLDGNYRSGFGLPSGRMEGGDLFGSDAFNHSPEYRDY